MKINPRLIWAVARKDALDLWMNKAAMGGLLAPIIISLVYLMLGRIIGGQKSDVIIYNPESSALAQVITAALGGPQVTEAASAGDVAAAFPSSGQGNTYPYIAGLVIPPGFDSQLRSGKKPLVELYFNDKRVGSQMQSLIQASIISYSRTVTNPEPPVEIKLSAVNQTPVQDRAEEMSKIYAPFALLVSLMIGTTFMPQLLIEEKEKKTLRMLMVSPVSFEDVLLGKLLVVLAYQLILTGVVLAIQDAYTGQVGLVVLFAVLGSFFSVALGLLLGSVFNTVSAANAVSGPIMIVYILAGMFVGPLGELLSSSPVARVARLLPTYYIADGLSNASRSLGSPARHLLDIGVVLGATLLLLAVSAWVLRRQSGVAAII
jgi:ABC-2 type transport system permease protein